MKGGTGLRRRSLAWTFWTRKRRRLEVAREPLPASLAVPDLDVLAVPLGQVRGEHRGLRSPRGEPRSSSTPRGRRPGSRARGRRSASGPPTGRGPRRARAAPSPRGWGSPCTPRGGPGCDAPAGRPPSSRRPARGCSKAYSMARLVISLKTTRRTFFLLAAAQAPRRDASRSPRPRGRGRRPGRWPSASLAAALQLVEHLLAGGEDLVLGGEALLDVHAQLLLGQVAHVAHGRLHGVVAARGTC